MAYTRRHWVDYPSTETPIDADALNNIEDGIEESHNIQLLAVTDTAPSECAEGDKYYDTTTKLIYTATGTNEWSETGETPIADILYIVLDEQTSYTYNGTTLVSVGGGSSAGGETLPVGSEIDYDGSTVPTGWEQIATADYMVACMTNDYTLTATNTSEILPIDKLRCSSGDKFTLVSDGIRVNAGVSAILVSGSVYWFSNVGSSSAPAETSSNINTLHPNGTSSNYTATNVRLIDNYEHIIMPTIIIPVIEGDIIRLIVKNQQNASTIKNYDTGTWLSVLAIG